MVDWPVEPLWQFSWPTNWVHTWLHYPDVNPKTQFIGPVSRVFTGVNSNTLLTFLRCNCGCLLAEQVPYEARHLLRSDDTNESTLRSTGLTSHLPLSAPPATNLLSLVRSSRQTKPITRARAVSHPLKSQWVVGDLPKITRINGLQDAAYRQHRLKAQRRIQHRQISRVAAYIRLMPICAKLHSVLPGWPGLPLPTQPTKVFAIAGTELQLVVECPICKGFYHYT